MSGKFIARGDVHDLGLSCFKITIRYSKTIQFGQRLLVLPFVACKDIRLCPVRALLTHLGSDSLSPTRPLFNFRLNGSEVTLTHAMFVKRLRSGLINTRFNPNELSCHSFRRGGASLAFECGLSPVQIKLRGTGRVTPTRDICRFRWILKLLRCSL